MKKLSFALFISLFLINSCIVVKYQGGGEDEEVRMIELSPKPEIPMSDELVRSPEGDMIAFLPEDWFFIDVEKETSSDIFAVAVNPDYTLSAVFSRINLDDRTKSIVDKEGLLGLARQSFIYHQKKSAGAVRQVGNFSKLEIGTHAFGKYDMTADISGYNSRAAVFISSIGNYYKITLIPMQIKNTPLPSDSAIDQIFQSILTTVNY